MKQTILILMVSVLAFGISCKKEEKEQEVVFNKIKGSYTLLSKNASGYERITNALIIGDSIYFKNEGTFAYTYYAINDLIPIKVTNKLINNEYVCRNDTIVFTSFYNFNPSVTPYYYVKQ